MQNLKFKTKLKYFKDSGEIIFYIASCKCPDFDKCSCQRECKIPKREHKLLKDQRNKRVMFIGGVDKQITGRLT